MPIELPWGWVTALNVVLCPLLQLGFAWVFTRMPARWFAVPPRPLGWEKKGGPYQRWFLVRRWKHLLPDGASWFEQGVAKRHLPGSGAEALRVFACESWRGEVCHWMVLTTTPLFFLWNPWWGDWVMALYLLAANLPCIIVQRYNRARLPDLAPRCSRT